MECLMWGEFNERYVIITINMSTKYCARFSSFDEYIYCSIKHTHSKCYWPIPYSLWPGIDDLFPHTHTRHVTSRALQISRKPQNCLYNDDVWCKVIGLWSGVVLCQRILKHIVRFTVNPLLANVPNKCFLYLAYVWQIPKINFALFKERNKKKRQAMRNQKPRLIIHTNRKGGNQTNMSSGMFGFEYIYIFYFILQNFERFLNCADRALGYTFDRITRLEICCRSAWNSNKCLLVTWNRPIRNEAKRNYIAFNGCVC